MLKRTLTFLLLAAFVVSTLFASSYVPKDRNAVNAFDRNFINPYNATLDKVATLSDYAFFLVPAAFVLDQDMNESAKIGVMYLETLGTAFLTKEIMKRTISRERPYLYTDTVDTKKEEWKESFPSGHTTGAFATASFTSYVFSQYYPDSKWKLPVSIACYGFATAEAIMRIKSGCHFPTDVLAGAAIGTAIGLGIPMLHTLGDNINASISPFGLLFDIQF